MKMRYCTYCGGLLDENTGVCPKCFGGIDAPKQEEQTAELSSIPKVDLGDGPFASAPSMAIPTLTLDPFGTSGSRAPSQARNWRSKHIHMLRRRARSWSCRRRSISRRPRRST